mmetsp:Transcript_49470/g.87098  ORF Transcript_49470/g.87098 Transcript_49470/m.87098 type:complete len:221 (-) Transcript_49470:103-765(-)
MTRVVAGSTQWVALRPARLLSALCCAVFAGRSEALFFELNPGENKECFKSAPGPGHRLIGSYEADGPAEGVVAVLQDSADKEMWRSTATAGKFDLKVSLDGTHILCFKSSSKDKQMVSFNFRVMQHGPDGEMKDPSRSEPVTKDHTDRVSELVGKLETRAIDILDQQQYTITREAVHRDTAESTNARVMWWTMLEVGTLIVLAAFQVYYLRSYFEVKQVV